jgi:hypothetical protein
MNKNKKKKLIKLEEIEITKILNEWDPIPSSPEDEYDCLTHQIISKLHNGASEKDIEILIGSEIINHFGIEEEKDTIKEVSKKIIHYWKNKPR